MKRLLFLLIILSFFYSGYAQTVENIQINQEGDQLKITYRIGASTESQLFRVYLSCSMDGATKFEPKAVIGDVGENVVGGKSYYLVMWDVFEDVDEVIDPNITIKVELMNDLAAPISRNTLEEEPVVPEPQQAEPQEQIAGATVLTDEGGKVDRFQKNGFFAYNGTTGLGIPIGISFGSLNNWGYYVTPMRMGIYSYDVTYNDGYETFYDTEIDFHYLISAGVTKHFVSGGVYRLHGYAGVGSHLYGANLKGLIYEPYFDSYFQFETGVVNVIGGLNLTLGLSYSAGYGSPLHLIFGIGFVF